MLASSTDRLVVASQSRVGVGTDWGSRRNSSPLDWPQRYAGASTSSTPFLRLPGLLGISRATAYALLRNGEIPARRIGSRWT
jgi:hypothetical protein